MSPILSIAIPTYNRAEFLEYVLSRLAEELQRCDSSEYEVVVLDNASTDATEGVCARATLIVPNLRVIRHLSNVGLTNNFESAYFHAVGKFVWLLCDDDAPEAGTVSKLIEALHAYPNAKAFLLNRNIYDIGMRVVIRSQCLSGSGERVLRRNEDKIRYCGEFLTASCSVIERDSALLGLRERAFRDTFCETLVLALAAMKRGDGVLLFDLFVRYRDGNNGSWNAYWPLIHVYFMPKVVDMVMADSGRSISLFKASRDSALLYNFCYLASTRNKKIQERVNERELRSMYSGSRWGDLLYSFAFDLPIWIPRFVVLAMSAIRVMATEIKLNGGQGGGGLFAAMRKRYGQFRAKETI